MSSKATPRIVIEDLPPLEQLSNEELADLFGAGRTSFRPTLEALEDRTLMSVNVVGISATPFSPTNHSGAPDTTAITIQHSGSGTDSNLKVLIENNTTVIRTLDAVFGSLSGVNKETLTWDGRNAAGMIVPDGTYNVVVDYNALSPTGKLTTSPSKSVVVDTTAPGAPTNLALSTGRTLTNNNRPTITGNAEAGSTVKLYDGSTLIGTAIATSVGTFRITLARALSDGTHTLTATATDAAGNTGPASSALSITVDTTPPAAPTNLALSTGGTLTNNNKPTITGNAEAGSTVTLYSGTTVLGSGAATSAGSFSITLTQTLSNGLNSLTAKAADAAGNNGPLSAVLSITVDTRAPNPPTNLALNSGGILTNNNKPTITGSALAGSTVKLYDGSALIGSAVATSAGTFSITLGTALGDGAHALTATAANAGHTGAASAVLNIVVDTTPPLAPTSLALNTGRTLTNNNRPTITGNAEAGSTVKLYDGSTLIGTAVATSVGTFSITLGTALSDGTHTLTAIATDAAGNTGPASVTFAVTIDTMAPAVTLTPPGVVNKANQGSVTVSGTSEAGVTITLTITDGNGTTVSATTTTGSNGAWSISNFKLSGLTDGTLTYSVTATDAAGNTSTAVSSTAIKDTVPPVAPTNLALASGTFSSSSYPTITGSAEAGSTVTLYEGTTVVGTGIANAGGTFRIAVTTALADGVHSLRATATDAAGNTGPTSSASSIVVDLPLTAGALIPPQAVEGQVLTNAVIFHFTDADPAAQASYYTATVQTGDGTTLTSSSNPQNVQVVANPNGGFDVLLSYGYADELVNGTFAVQVADQGGESTGASTSSFTVADAPLTATGKNITTTKGAPFSGVVGTFTDANPFATAANFSATITWGDGQTSAGTIAYDSANKVFTVTGSNTYAAQGDYVVAVTITDVGGSTALATSTAAMVSLVSLTGASAPLHIGGNGSFTLNLDGNSVPLDVTLSVDPSSTLAGYTFGGPGVTVNGTTLTVHFDPGQVSATITLTPLNTTGMAEGASTLTLDLQSGSGYTLSPTQASVTANIAANGFEVTNTNPSGNGSLAQAVANANADTTGQPIVITFAAATGQLFATAQTIQLTGTLELSNTTAGASISIQGPSAGLTIQGAGSKASFAVLTVDAGVTAMLDDLTITNGSNLASYAVGGAISNAGTLTVSNSVISGNTASYGGGGIGNTGMLTVTDCTFSNNSATNNYGGGIYNSYGTVTVTGCTFSGNSAGDGGGIYNYYAYYGHGTVAVSNTTFSGNSAIWAGGGILDYGALTVNNSSFSGNSAPSGSGMALVYGGNATLTGTTLADNGAGSDLYLDSGSGSTVSATSIQIDSGSYAQVITATDTAGGTNVYLVDSTGAVFVYQANQVSAQQVGTSSVQTTDGTLWFLGTGSLDSGGVYTLSGGKLSLAASGVTALATGVYQGVPSVFELRSDGTVWAASSLTNAHLVGTVTQMVAGPTVNGVTTTFYVLDSGTILAWNGKTCASIQGVQQWVTCDYQSQVSMAIMQTNGYLSVWTGTSWVAESSNCAQIFGGQTYVSGANFVIESEDRVLGWNGTQFQDEPGFSFNNVWMACTYNGQVTAALLLPDRTVDVWTGRAWAQIGTSGVLFDDICIWYVAGTDPASGQKLIENVGTQFVASIPNGLANALYNGIAGASLTDVVVALHSGISYIYPWQIADGLQSVNGATIDSVASALCNANLGWSVNAIAAAVQGAFGAGDQVVAKALQSAGVSAGDIVSALQSVFGDTEVQVVSALFGTVAQTATAVDQNSVTTSFYLLNNGSLCTVNNGMFTLLPNSGITALASGAYQGMQSVFELRTDGTVWAASSHTNPQQVGTVTQTETGIDQNGVTTNIYLLNNATLLGWTGATCQSLSGVTQWVACSYNGEPSAAALVSSNETLYTWTGSQWLAQASGVSQLIGSQPYAPGAGFVILAGGDYLAGWDGSDFQKLGGAVPTAVASWVATDYQGQPSVAALSTPGGAAWAWTGGSWTELTSSADQLIGSQTYQPGNNFSLRVGNNCLFGWDGATLQAVPNIQTVVQFTSNQVLYLTEGGALYTLTGAGQPILGGQELSGMAQVGPNQILLLDHDGTLYAVSPGQQPNPEAYGVENLVQFAANQALYLTKTGNLYSVSSGGQPVLVRSQLQGLAQFGPNQVLYLDQAGALWQYAYGQQPTPVAYGVQNMVQFGDNEVLYATTDGELYSLAMGGTPSYQLYGVVSLVQLGNNQAMYLLYTKDLYTWAVGGKPTYYGTAQSLLHVGTSQITYVLSNGDVYSSVDGNTPWHQGQSAVSPGDGTIWFLSTTNDDGNGDHTISRYSNGQITQVGLGQGTQIPVTATALAMCDGSIWITNTSHQVWRFNGSEWIQQACAVDSGGNVWFLGTQDSAGNLPVYQFSHGQLNRTTLADLAKTNQAQLASLLQPTIGLNDLGVGVSISLPKVQVPDPALANAQQILGGAEKIADQGQQVIDQAEEIASQGQQIIDQAQNTLNDIANFANDPSLDALTALLKTGDNYDQVKAENQVKYGWTGDVSNMYFSSTDFVNWASPETAATWVAALASGPAAIPAILADIEVQLTHEAQPLLQWLEDRGLAEAQDAVTQLAKALITGSSLSFGSVQLNAKLVTVDYSYGVPGVSNQLIVPHLGFVIDVAGSVADVIPPTGSDGQGSSGEGPGFGQAAQLFSLPAYVVTIANQGPDAKTITFTWGESYPLETYNLAPGQIITLAMKPVPFSTETVAPDVTAYWTRQTNTGSVSLLEDHPLDGLAISTVGGWTGKDDAVLNAPAGQTILNPYSSATIAAMANDPSNNVVVKV